MIKLDILICMLIEEIAAGGIYNRVKYEEYKRPKDLTDEYLKTLFSFFQIIGLKILANAFGYKLKFPNIKN